MGFYEEFLPLINENAQSQPSIKFNQKKSESVVCVEVESHYCY
jgi:hypothetical protein